MVCDLLQSFRSIAELQKSLEKEINLLKIKSDEMSKLVGEKLRATESANTADLQEFRQKLEGGPTDPKKKGSAKKSSTKKKDQKGNWYNFDSVSVYDGIGLKGELELYFKGMEDTKSQLERLSKIKEGIDDLVNKGLKKDLGCVMLLKNELPSEIAFTTTLPQRKRFAYKAIFNIPKEELNEIYI